MGEKEFLRRGIEGMLYLVSLESLVYLSFLFYCKINDYLDIKTKNSVHQKHH